MANAQQTSILLGAAYSLTSQLVQVLLSIALYLLGGVRRLEAMKQSTFHVYTHIAISQIYLYK